MKKSTRSICTAGMVIMSLFVILSCATHKTRFIESDQTSGDRKAAFQKIIFNAFESEDRLSSVRPGIATACEEAALNELMKIGSAPMIYKTTSGLVKQENSLIVRVHLRFAESKTDRQPSKIIAYVRLIEASTGKTLNEENIAAPPAKKSSKENPKDLGVAIARHIDKFIREP